MTQLPTDDELEALSEDDALKIATLEELVGDFSEETYNAETGSELLQEHQVISVFVDKRQGNFFEGTTTTVQGDVSYDKSGHVPPHVGRDERHSAGLDGRRVPQSTERVLGEDFDRIKTVYVKVNEYDEAFTQLQRNGIFFLYGRAAYGKWTTALHMLSTIHENRIFELMDFRKGT